MHLPFTVHTHSRQMYKKKITYTRLKCAIEQANQDFRQDNGHSQYVSNA